MKKILSQTSKNIHGFTLIELLVVIAILAVLATIGFAVYSGLGAQAKARNITRRSDMEAIGKALEASKPPTGLNYVVLAAGQFVNDAIPSVDSQGNLYCANTAAITGAGAGLYGDPVASWGTTCPTVGTSVYGPVGTTNPIAGPSWKICAWLEAETNPVVAARVFCKLSAQ